MALFISYSSRDAAALAPVSAALHRAHIEAWLDEELTGGEAWWNAILEQIRSCEVFIAALSKNYLESKPCQAELRYAQELNRPILPVQIGPLDSMRINPLASVQAIDYQNPSIDSGIELISAVHARKANTVPLPSPLPEPPSVPFAYLMRLNTAVAAPELTAAEQAQLFSDLSSGLDTDGHEPSARRDLIQLLIRLRDRPDITWKTRTDVEKVLTSIQTENIPVATRSTDAAAMPSGNFSAPPPPGWTAAAPAYAAGPPPSAVANQAAPPIPPGPAFGSQPMAMPPYAPPDTNAARPRKSRKRWIIAGAAAAAVAAAATVVILIIPGPTPPPKPPTITAAQLNSVLLSSSRINSIMGASHMQAGDVVQKMANESASVVPANCIGALYTAENATYGGSDWSGVSDQTLQQQSTTPNTDVGHFYVDQTAVIFPSADKAKAFFNTSASNWRSCAGQSVTVTNTDNQSHWNFRDVTQTNTKIVQSRTQDAGDNWACQHALSTVSNLVVEVVACGLQVNDQASQISDEMIANATH